MAHIRKNKRFSPQTLMLISKDLLKDSCKFKPKINLKMPGKKGLNKYHSQFGRWQISFKINKGKIKTNQKVKSTLSLFPSE